MFQGLVQRRARNFDHAVERVIHFQDNKNRCSVTGDNGGNRDLEVLLLGCLCLLVQIGTLIRAGKNQTVDTARQLHFVEVNH